MVDELKLLRMMKRLEQACGGFPDRRTQVALDHPDGDKISRILGIVDPLSSA